jgi:hypothetical protein
LCACPRGNLELARTPIVAEPFLTIDKPLKMANFIAQMANNISSWTLRFKLTISSTIKTFENGNLFQKSEFASLPLKPPKVPHVIGAGGATHPIQGQIDLQFSIGGFLLSQTFYVIPALRQPMILGTDFLQNNEVCLDWQNNTLSD